MMKPLHRATQKRILASLLIMVLFLGFAETTLAQGDFISGGSEFKGASEGIYCTSWTGISISGCVLMAITAVGWAMLAGVSWVLWFAAKTFNIILAIQNDAFHAPNNAFVVTGWTIARDVSNIFYILFLLIISIATILRIESYGWKQLLPKLIISALLLNFSLAFTGVIVDLSNVLGNTFYIKIGGAQDPDLGGMSGARDISTVFMKGFAPQKVFEIGNSNAMNNGTSNWDTVINMLIAIAAGIVLILVASFVLFAGAWLLMIRIIVLWILMVLSPFAFLFMILPETRGYASQWFKSLFSQAFFYPAYMFMFYLVVIVINKRVLLMMFKTTGQDGLNQMFSGGNQGGASLVTQKANLILSMVFLGILMIAALMVAKQMGAYGANTAMAYGKRVGKWGRGQAARPAYWAGRMANRGVEKTRAYEGGAKVASQMARIPLVGAAIGRTMQRPFAAGMRKAEQDRKTQATAQAALAKDLPAKSAASIAKTLNARGKAELWNGMKDEKKRREFINEMSMGDRVAFGRAIHATDESKKYNQQVAKASGDLSTALKITRNLDEPGESATSEERANYQREADNFFIGLSDKEKKEFMGADAVRSNANIQNHIINNFSISDVGRTVSNADEAKAMGELLERAKGDEKLKAVNPKLYNRLNSSPGGVIIIDRLKSGQVLRPSDYGQERKREKDEGRRAPKPPEEPPPTRNNPDVEDYRPFGS